MTLDGSEEFAQKFSEFNDIMLKIPGLNTLWGEFRETLVLPSPMDPPVIYNADQSGCCFNLSSIVPRGLNLKFYGAVPNYLTGLGILGTFIGLVCGISLASHGLASNDSTELQKSLQGLLDGASLAFITSIVGLILSIIFSFFEKYLVNNLEEDILKWNEELDRRIERITIQSIGVRQTRHLERQADYLESFANDVAVNLSNAIDQGVNQKLVPVLDKLATEVQGMRQDRSHSNEAMLRDVVGQFTQSMTGAAGQEIAALSGSLAAMNNSLAPLVSQMSEAQQAMQGAAVFIAEQVRESYTTGSQAFSEGIREAIEALGTSVKDAGQTLHGDMKSAFDEAVQRLRDTIDAMQNSVGSVRDAGAVSSDVVAKAKDLLGEFHMVSDTMQSLGLRFDSSVQRMEGVSGGLAEAAKSIQHAGNSAVSGMDSLKQGLERFEQMQNKLHEIWQDYAKRFSDLDTTLARVFMELDRGMNAFAESTKAYMGQLDEQSGRALHVIGGAVKELNNTVEEMTEALSNTLKSIKA